MENVNQAIESAQDNGVLNQSVVEPNEQQPEMKLPGAASAVLDVARRVAREEDVAGPDGEFRPDTEAEDGAADLFPELSGAQCRALETLSSGGTLSAAGRAAGVDRRTIYRWLEAGNPLASAYERWKNSIAETTRTRLLMIGEAATVQVARAIREGDTRTALAVVRGLGLLSPPPVGPSLTQSVAKREEARAAKAQQQLADDSVGMSFSDLVKTEHFGEEMRRADEREAGLLARELRMVNDEAAKE